MSLKRKSSEGGKIEKGRYGKNKNRSVDRPEGKEEKRENVTEDPWARQLLPESLAKSVKTVYNTVTMAIPGSILRSAQTKELRSYLVGQIARAAAIHEIDEIVVFVDSAYEASAPDLDKTPSVICCRLLQYLECPSYLRKALFPVHSDLALAGLLPPLDTPHHMRREDVSLYREGVVVENKVSADGCYVNVGLSSEAFIGRHLRPGVRVTVELDEPEVGTNSGNSRANSSGASRKIPTGNAVAPTQPRVKHGLYWGYQTRLAKTFGDIFTECPHKGGYDILVGNSTKGIDVDTIPDSKLEEIKQGTSANQGKHILIVFGGSVGIENCVDADETLATPGRDAETLFDLWTNLCPSEGSKQVRTEELVLAGLSGLKRVIKKML